MTFKNMELDYDKLDDILKFLRTSGDYQGWDAYRRYVAHRDNIFLDTTNTAGAYAVWGNILFNWNLVSYRFDGNLLHTYIINPNGLDLVNNELSTRTVHEDIKNRAKLEDKILESTIDSHNTSKAATRLNLIQLIVTIILGLVSAFTIYTQWQANKISQKSLEAAEKAYQLELENKVKIDTIFVKIDSFKSRPVSLVK